MNRHFEVLENFSLDIVLEVQPYIDIALMISYILSF